MSGSTIPAPWGDNVQDTTTCHRAPMLFLALLALVALVVAACGGSSGGSKSGGGGNASNGGLPTNNPGTPQKGGTITYGLEGKTTAFCPPRGQWAISGIMVASAVYDTLTQPTDKPNVYAPYLAKSVDQQRRLQRRGRSCCAAASSSTTVSRSTPTR